MSRATVSARGQTASPHTEMLIKNLRLLDLDEEFDWPGITSTTFAAASLVKDQKDRVRYAEWILYKLFVHWDPSETSKNLSQYFPALEPRQSKNLRAGIFKALNEMRSNGVFHKDIVIRRTMLDDCKGPKFEELLGTFSTMVLLKVLSREKRDGSITKRTVLGQQVSDKQQAQLLNVAYQVSCTRTLRQREAYDKRWQKFGRSLRSQKEELDLRQKVLEGNLTQRKEKKIPQRTLDRLRRHVDSNWNGDAEWVGILLRSDQHRPQMRILERPFGEIWSHACEDTLYAVRPQRNDSLLQTLEKRVDQQTARLDRWRAIQENLVLQAQAMGLHTEEEKEGSLVFDDDDDIQDEWDGTESVGGGTKSMQPINASRNLSYNASSQEKARDTSPGKHKLSLAPEPIVSYVPAEQALQSSPSRRTHMQAKDLPTDQRQYDMLPPSRSPERSSPTRRWPDLPEEPPRQAGAQEALAAQILSSVMNAEPSPLRPPKPSLEERARMSMARASPQKMDLQPPVDLHSIQQQDATEIARPSMPTTPDRIQSLAERTRQSMSLMSARPKPRKSRVSRISNIYPTNQFETPRKPSGPAIAETPLFDESLENLDAESIFKSRPKIAMSPIVQATPSAAGIDETLTLDDE